MKKITLVLLLMSHFLVAQKDTIYINPDATGNGSGDSWENGIPELGVNGFLPFNGNIIWMKKGEYFPKSSIGFLIPESIEIFGGFNGTENTLKERSLETDTTTLNGQVSDFQYSEHIFYANDSTMELRIDGLKLMNSSAGIQLYDQMDYPAISNGAGVYLRAKPNAEINITNCVFDKHFAWGTGAAIFIKANDYISVSITKSTFSNCISNEEIGYDYGRGIIFIGGHEFTTDFSKVTINESEFFDNSNVFDIKADSFFLQESSFYRNTWGSYCRGNSVFVSDCIFSDNISGLIVLSRFCTINTCNFSENYSGLILLNPDYIKIFASNFDNNIVGLYHSSGIEFDNCIFSSNDSLAVYSTGIAVYNNCLFYDNGVDSIHSNTLVNLYDEIKVNNCIFYKNKSSINGKDIACSRITAENCFFSEKDSSDISDTYYYYLWDSIDDKLDTILGASYNYLNNNFAIDPQFIDEANQDFHLRLCSPAIDAGLNEVISQGSTDYDGNPRIINNTVDIGPYEFDLASYSIEVEDVSCQTGSDGAINLLGGIEGYDITWESNGQTGSNLEGLSAGTYHLSISDGDCALERTIEIHEPDHFGIKSKIGQDDGSNSGFIRIDSVFNGVAPYQLDWDTGAMGNEIIDLATGAYRLSVTDAKGCLTTFEFFIEDVSAVSDYLSRSIQVSPNPASDFVNLQVDGFEIDKIEIYDIQGTKIKNVTSSQSNFNKIDVSNLVNGTYFLRLKSGDLFGFKKMIILK